MRYVRNIRGGCTSIEEKGVQSNQPMCGHLQHQGEKKLDGICAIFVKHDFRDMVVGGFCVFAIDCEDA